MLPDAVREKLERLPASPGVYLFRDKHQAIVYVGKAKSLRNRVRSYFQASTSDTRYFIPLLQEVIGDFDTIVTETEKAAAILENSLIKQHMPRFNVKLRDDKEYLSLKLNLAHSWPRLDLVRRAEKDGARYFGPYHSATAARRTLHLINKHFQLRTCSDTELASRRRPCLQYQIKRCPAPCVLPVEPAWYAEQVKAVTWFIDGRHDELSRELKERMADAARSLRFELAAVYRDQLAAIEEVRQKQNIVSADFVDRDVVGIYREGDLAEIALLYVRAGKLADVATFSLKGAEVPTAEIVSAFLRERYLVGTEEEAKSALVPTEIVVPEMPDAAGGVAELLSETAGKKVALVVPQRGAKVELLALANENARHSYLEKHRARDDIEERLAQLKERLRLPTLPRRIECCDISHLGGGDTVGAIVAMNNGVPDKKRYRTFHVRFDVSPQANAGDDYGAMYEVLARRFRRGEAAEKDSDWELPDLFVVDGGRGQLGVALAAARDLGLHQLPIVGLAKEKENVMGEELVDRVYLPGQKNPIPLKTHSASLFFLARLRDEAHRFSNRAREKLGKSKRFRSALDDVKGLGPKTKKALLTHLGTLTAVTTATDAALLAIPGVTRRHVDALRAVFPLNTETPKEAEK